VRTVRAFSGLLAIALWTATAVAAQAPVDLGTPSPSRQAADRRVDESSRQTQGARQTEPPKPADKSAAAGAKTESKPSTHRQPQAQRQPEPPRQREPGRQAEPSRQGSPDHWKDPGPAWRSLGPAWRDLNDRPGIDRPGEDAFRAGQKTYAPRDRNNRGRRDRNVYIAVPYPVPSDLVPYYPSQLAPEPAPGAPASGGDDRPLGFLQLRVQPRTAEVFVDGAFAGSVDDFGGRGARQLPAGPHRVEVVARGFETLTFDVRVPENDTVTFSRELEPIVDRPAAAPEPVAIPHKALYVVPQCYIGDRPPQQSDMPAGCRVEDVRVIP